MLAHFAKFSFCVNSPPWRMRCVFGFGGCHNMAGANRRQVVSPNGVLIQKLWVVQDEGFARDRG